MGLFNRRKKSVSDRNEILVLYASKSGNAKLIAQQANQFYRNNGLKSTCLNMAKYNPDDLGKVEKLVAVVSTDGEGDPPPDAERFFTNIGSASMPVLKNLKYAICALGDSSYEKYCEAGKYIDQRLEELEAIRLLERTDCDADFSGTAAQWIKSSLLKLKDIQTNSVSLVEKDVFISEKQVYTGNLLSRKILSTNDEEFPCFHIEIDIKNSDFTFEAGDCIELRPENPVDMVNEILTCCRINPVEMVSESMSISGMLLKELEIIRLSHTVIQKYALLGKIPELIKISEDKEACNALVKELNFLQLLKKFPFPFKTMDLTGLLSPIKYRQYTIASAPDKNSGKIDLLLKNIASADGQILGSASNYLCNTLLPNQPLHFRLYQSAHFHLPREENLPIIMIGVGTGIAPYRAFLQQIEKTGNPLKTWLIFGEKKKENHFYYENEWQKYLEKSTLQKLDMAFSRDQTERRYVQHIVSEQGETLINWLKDGGHIYVCGSLKMGRDIKKCIREILNSNGDENLQFEQLVASSRYHEDVY